MGPTAASRQNTQTLPTAVLLGEKELKDLWESSWHATACVGNLILQSAITTDLHGASTEVCLFPSLGLLPEQLRKCWAQRALSETRHLRKREPTHGEILYWHARALLQTGCRQDEASTEVGV